MTMTENNGRPVGADDETAVVAVPAVTQKQFARRRFRARLRRSRPLLYGALVVVGVLVGTWLVYFSSAVAVRGVQVTGNSSIAAARIERLAQAPVGRPLARVDLAAIQARVEALPAVGSAEVSRSWPHTIKIAITERVPVAVVDRGAGLQAIDASGVLFGHYAHRPASLPLVKTAPDVKADALAEVAKVVAALRPDIAAKVEHVDVETVDKISLSMTGGVDVVWGSAAGSVDKAKVLAILLKQKVHQIDVSVPGRPTTR
jgi:cell division protein FtsQ